MPYFGVLEGFLKGIYKGSIKGLGFRVVRVSENWGVPYFGVYYNKDPTIYRTILGPPVFGNSHKDFEQRAEGVVLRRFRVRVLGWFRAGQGGFPTLVYFFCGFVVVELQQGALGPVCLLIPTLGFLGFGVPYFNMFFLQEPL